MGFSAFYLQMLVSVLHLGNNLSSLFRLVASSVIGPRAPTEGEVDFNVTSRQHKTAAPPPSSFPRAITPSLEGVFTSAAGAAYRSSIRLLWSGNFLCGARATIPEQRFPRSFGPRPGCYFWVGGFGDKICPLAKCCVCVYHVKTFLSNSGHVAMR
uniref:Putative secreted protein n=1 Tax=Anopheles marajoara TaxID=58244 RepID=A0A2M4C6T0_9DIPT